MSAVAAAIIGGGVTLIGSTIGALSSSSAADTQSQSAQNALDFQKQMWNTQQENTAPYMDAGKQSIGSLMDSIGSGKNSVGSMADFSAPTLSDVQNTPGYQFTAQQGSKGVLQGAAAAGGNISGGTMKALDSYNSNLANTTYNDAFNRAMQSYSLNLNKQQQGFNQSYDVARLGESAATNTNATGSSVASNAGNLMTSIGNSQAAGTVGVANAVNSGISSTANNLSQYYLMNQNQSASAPINAQEGVTPMNYGNYATPQVSYNPEAFNVG
jgi:hypothetical protein